MGDNNEKTLKYVLASVSTVALGALVWYLSKEYRDPFSKHRLQRLMEEIKLELTCIYTHNYNLLLRVKEENPNDFGPGHIKELRTRVNSQIKAKQNQLIGEFCFACHSETHSSTSGHTKQPLTFKQYVSWIETYADEDFLTKQVQKIAQLDSDLFERQHISHISFKGEIPEDFTPEKYLQISKKIWATIRHDLWKEI